MKAAARKSFWLTIAFFCLALAAIGSLLPIMQGWIFFLIALAIFIRESETVRRWVRAARNRWPEFSAKINAVAQHRRVPNVVKNIVRETDPHL